jgi:Ca-activated chloride channel homolog
MRFANPEFLWLLLLIPVMVVYYQRRGNTLRPRLVFSALSTFSLIPKQGSLKMRHSTLVLRSLVVFLVVVALARPQVEHRSQEISTYGVDIMLALDASGSMQAEDFKPENRLGAAKQEARKFIMGRKHDRMGLVVFAGESYTQCPLTLDYDILLKFLEEIRIGVIEDGTAIGLAITSGVNRLRDSDAKSRVIVLLTDGVNNAGEIDPITAAQVAESFGIKIYTIGAGRDGEKAPFPVQDPFFGKSYRWEETKLDEKALREIADITGGRYFQARDESALREVFETIDRLEKSRIEATDYVEYSERFGFALFPALGFFGIELLLSRTRFRTLP